MIVNTHSSQHSFIVTVCDKDLIGKTFSEGNMQLDFTSKFYAGEEIEENKTKELMKKATTIIFAGEKSMAFGKKNRYIDDGHILFVEKIPYAQCIHL